MYRCLLILLAASAPALSGCGLMQNAARTAIHEPCFALDNCCLEHRADKWAKKAWQEWCGKRPAHCPSSTFEDGFRAGYADFLVNGGNAEPVAAPPYRLRKHKYATYDGYLAVEDYFAGFRVGSECAVASGRRALFLIPVLWTEAQQQDYPTPPNWQPASGADAGRKAESTKPPDTKPTEETAPAPKAVDKPEKPEKSALPPTKPSGSALPPPLGSGPSALPPVPNLGAVPGLLDPLPPPPAPPKKKPDA